MSSPLKNWYFITAFLLLLPSAVFAASIQIIGTTTTCVQGPACPLPAGPTDALAYSGSESNSGSYTLTLGDGDKYLISWIDSASFGSSTEILFDPVVTYIGSTTTITNDVITVSMFENYYDASPGNWDSPPNYVEDVPLTLNGTLGSGSEVSAQLFYTTDTGGGGGLGAVTLVGDGSSFTQKTKSLTGLDGDTLEAKYQFTFDFEPGTGDGATASSTPEPAETLPLGLALAGVACFQLVVRRRSSCSR